MNSSVTLESAISVMSSLCFEIRPSSRSKGPSKTSRCTSKPLPARVSPGSLVIVVVIQYLGLPPRYNQLAIMDLPSLRQGLLPEPPGHHAPVALGVQVGQQDRERLPDDPATIHRDAEGP